MGREDVSACMGLRARILQALKDESESIGDESKRATLRLIECAIRDRDVCARGRGQGEGCPDEDVRRVLETLVVQRETSARVHDAEGRIEDAIREREEIAIIQQYLPKPLSGKALDIAVKQVVDDLGASKLTDLGRCVTALKERYPGLIEASSAGKVVRTALSKAR
ncbi:GatB/YqeY domain-containing protein [Hyphomonas sp.]|uniref:GatB/YqeY domain-containing protein n=1 Tax=Hyphomonas sp. TaxID=87 RepID=UPI0025C005B1|nr:GatB/YqeY domain-containing protein [Hyphomonas sp.]